MTRFYTMGFIFALAAGAWAQSTARAPQSGFGSFGGQAIPYVSQETAQRMMPAPAAYSAQTQLALPKEGEAKTVVTMNLPPGYSDQDRRGILVVEVGGMQTRRVTNARTSQSVCVRMTFQNTSKVQFEFDPMHNASITDNAGGTFIPDAIWQNGWELTDSSITMDPGSSTEVDLFFDVPQDYSQQRLARFDLNWKYFNSHHQYLGHVVLTMFDTRKLPDTSADQGRPAQRNNAFPYEPDMVAGPPAIPQAQGQYPTAPCSGPIANAPNMYWGNFCAVPDPVYTVGSSFNTLVMTAAIPFEAVMEAMGGSNPGMGIKGYGGPGAGSAMCGGGTGNCGMGLTPGYGPNCDGPVSRTATRAMLTAKMAVRTGVAVAFSPLNLLCWSGLSPKQPMLGPTVLTMPPGMQRREPAQDQTEEDLYEPQNFQEERQSTKEEPAASENRVGDYQINVGSDKQTGKPINAEKQNFGAEDNKGDNPSELETAPPDEPKQPSTIKPDKEFPGGSVDRY